ncbi:MULTISPECIES: hypothetical protein [Xanthomonas]|uniref:hypothetical protein n=1 Tax=Xanthomonas TaxID=338 RepID=UPI002254BD8B|nr:MULTISPECIES: hypothetical protein [Xanthomonas]MCW0393563.1 hypothetical protein [Xanthomonas sacchari]MCW0445265.1 hypothetical protein [Xanthomonas sacchari]MDY4283057.1 hypothetical protein [Xanthomonas sp. LF06-19]
MNSKSGPSSFFIAFLAMCSIAQAQAQTTLTTITVTAPKPNEVQGNNTSTFAFFSAFEYSGGSKGGDETDSEKPDDTPGQRTPADELSEYNDFNALPDALKNIITSSGILSAQLLQFFQNNGRIQVVEGLGVYQAQYTPGVLKLDAETLRSFGDGNADYHARVFVSSIAHEVGHAMDKTSFTGSTAAEYENYRAVREANAILNSMLVTSELENTLGIDVIMTGYGTDAQLTALFNNFAQNRQIDPLIDSLKNLVKSNTLNTQGLSDLNGDGSVDQYDRYRQDYNNGYR